MLRYNQKPARQKKKKGREKFRAFILFLVFGSKFYTPAPSLGTNSEALNFLHSLCNETWVTLSYTAGEFRVVATRRQTGPAAVQFSVGFIHNACSACSLFIFSICALCECVCMCVCFLLLSLDLSTPLEPV